MSAELFATTFVTLFVLIDPIGLAPLFVALTRGMEETERRRVALRAIAVAFGLLMIFGLAGEPILKAIGISIPAFRISGGMLLFLMAVDMQFEKRSERRGKRAKGAQPDPSVFPLAMPLIAGPGALTGMILLTSKHSGDLGALIEVHVVLVVMLALTWALFRAGGMIERLLGATGVVVVTRLLGILLAALAVQFVLDGLRAVGAIGAAT
jgi:multiple antibiotic resistance protein